MAICEDKIMGGLATGILATKIGGTTIGSILSTTATVGGTALSVAGTLQAGRAAEAQSDIEATLAESQAVQEEARGLEEERLRRRAGESLKARQVAQFAKGGVRVGEGTPLLVMAETILDTQEDISAIKEGTQARTGAFRLKGRTFRAIGKAAKTASRFKAGTSLLSGISGLTRSNP